MELPIALAAVESLRNHPQLAWAAFVDAAGALRERLWLPPPYRFVVGPYTEADRTLALALQQAGRQVEVLPTAGASRAAPPTHQLTSSSSAPLLDLDRHRMIGDRLHRFDEHARLGWAAAIVLTDGAADTAAVSLAVAAYRHHRRLELREIRIGADPAWVADTNLDGLRAVPPGNSSP